MKALNCSGNIRGKLLAMFGLLIAIVVAWEAKRMRENAVSPTPLPAIKNVEPPRPVKRKVPTPPPLKKEKRKPVAPVMVPKKPVTAPKKGAPPAAVPAPRVPAVVPTPVPNVLVPVPAPSEPREWQGSDTSVTHTGQVVIHNDRQWVHFWSEHHPHEAAPDIDFTRDMVIGVFVGPRPAEPFSIRILQVRWDVKSLVVDYRERLPPPGTFAVNVTVYPYDLKVIPLSTLPVKFNLLAPENVTR